MSNADQRSVRTTSSASSDRRAGNQADDVPHVAQGSVIDSGSVTVGAASKNSALCRAKGRLAAWREQAAEWCDENLMSAAEQRAAASLLVVVWLVGLIWWIAHGGLTGRLIDIDRAAPIPLSFVVNINEADVAELSQLPGIGATLASRIIESRNAEGPFRSVEDLRRIRGIGPKTVETLRPYVVALPGDGGAVAAERP